MPASRSSAWKRKPRRSAQAAEQERQRVEAERAAAAKQQEFVVHSVATGLEKLSSGDLLFRLTTAFRRRLREAARRFQRGDGEAAGDDAGDRHQHAGRALGRRGNHPGLG